MKRITYPAACVLRAIAAGKAYGFEIMEFTRLPSGTVYPALRRFEREGMVESSWESPDTARDDRRPRRRNYRITARGREMLVAATERFRLHTEIFGSAESGTKAAP